MSIAIESELESFKYCDDHSQTRSIFGRRWIVSLEWNMYLESTVRLQMGFSCTISILLLQTKHSFSEKCKCHTIVSSLRKVLWNLTSPNFPITKTFADMKTSDGQNLTWSSGGLARLLLVPRELLRHPDFYQILILQFRQ